MTSDRRGNATIAAAVVPPPTRPAPRTPRPSQQDTMAVPSVAAVARRMRPSQQETMAVPIVMGDDDTDPALGRTMIPGMHTQIATQPPPRGGGNKTMIATPVAQRSTDSSLEIPIVAVLSEEELPRTRRQITLGDGMLERVPPRRMWILHAAVIVATLSIAVVALAAGG
jgi:hypothetical protein